MENTTNRKKQGEQEGKKKGKGSFGLYFLGLVIALYIILYSFSPAKTLLALGNSADLLKQMIPIVALVITLMAIMNHFINRKLLVKYVGKESGAKGWFLAIIAGVLSHGSIYLWYPFIQDLRSQGMRSGLAAAFLYNRAIKIPLLPFMVYYFELKFVAVLMLLMVIGSVVEGLVLELFVD